MILYYISKFELISVRFDLMSMKMYVVFQKYINKK